MAVHSSGSASQMLVSRDQCTHLTDAPAGLCRRAGASDVTDSPSLAGGYPKVKENASTPAESVTLRVPEPEFFVVTRVCALGVPDTSIVFVTPPTV